VKRSIKLGLLLSVAAAVLAFGATPAGAHQGVSVFQGTAQLDAGLGLPVLTGGTTNFRIVVTDSGTASPLCQAVGLDLSVGPCAFDVDGTVGPSALVGGIGAACGMSSGTSAPDPKGSPDTFTAGDTHGVTLGWVATAGSILPITGTHTGGGLGTFVSLVSARAGANAVETVQQCLAGTASSFSVSGVAALL
jgi:hypothetical protein